VRYWPSGSY